MTMDFKQTATLPPPGHFFGGRGPVITLHKTDEGRSMDTSMSTPTHSHPVLGRTLAQPISSGPTSVRVSTVIRSDRRQIASPVQSQNSHFHNMNDKYPEILHRQAEIVIKSIWLEKRRNPWREIPVCPSGYSYGATHTISGSQLSSLGLNQNIATPVFLGSVPQRGTVLSSSSPSSLKRLSDDWLPSPTPISMDSPPPSNYPPSTTNLSSSNGGCSPSGSYEPYSPSGQNGREDLSPGSVNGYTTPIDGFDPKKKKGPQPRQQDELCLVCGDRASGYHYNALTCEGCKGFFRRSITKNAVYQCKYGASCEIDMYMRRKCQECRLKKCLSVGMRPECVVPEQQCAVKREAKKQQKEKDKPNSITTTTTTTIDIRDADSVKEEKSYELASLRKRLTAEQEELIHRLVFFQEEFENPGEEDVKRVTQLSLEADDSERGFRTVTEMTILTVQLTVEFSKRLPGFDTLLREDQITLLKACSSEVMMLRGSRKYDAETDSIVFANNLPYTKDRYSMSGVEYTADELYGFARKMYCLKTDNAEYALITAIVIFSDRAGLIEPKKVEKIQEIYMDTLSSYVFTHRQNPTVEFAKLINIPTTLRTLGTMNADLCMALKLKNKRLPQFLREIWDI